MSEIHVKDNESLDSALKRFKRSCSKAGVLPRFEGESNMRAPASKTQEI